MTHVLTHPMIPMSQGDLYLVLPLAWQAYRDQLPRFTAYKTGYTAAVADAQDKALAAAKALPDDAARSAAAETVRLALLPQATEYLAAWHQLDGYIEEAYPAAYASQRDAAGHAHYEAAARHDWAELTALITAGQTFGRDHKTELLAQGQMPPDFLAKTLAPEADDVTTLLNQYQQLKGSSQQGTAAQQAANMALYTAYQKMNRDAQRIFRMEPDTARLFQTEYLLSLVRGPGQAGVRGTLTVAGGAPAAGVTVAIAGAKTESTVSDGHGRYALAVPAGAYQLTFSGAGYAAQETAVTVQAGVKKRVDGVMGK